MAIIEVWFEQDVRLFEYLWERRGVMRLVLEGGGSHDHRHLMELFAKNAEDLTMSFIRHGIECGYYRADVDPRCAATFIAGGYDRLARRLVRESVRPDIRQWIAEAQSLCLRALGTPAFVSAAAKFYHRLLESHLPNRAVG
jgi:hypothetical protein